MKKVLCLIAVLAVSAVLAELSEIEAKSQFADYIQRFNKNYQQEEFDLRFNNFKESLKRIDRRNQKSQYATFGLTKFSDMSVEEFKNTILMKKTIQGVDKTKVVLPEFKLPEGAPTSLDWRAKGAITPVKDQEQCGSCWAFSATEEIESAWIMHINNSTWTNETTILAPQQIVDCDWGSAGCNGGEPYTAYDYVRITGGMELNADYPYTGEDGSCSSDSSEYVAHISSWSWASGLESEADIQANIQNQPLSICVYAESWMDYTSGVFTESDCENSFFQLDHCVQLVGYDTTGSIYPYKTPFWIVRNSWNTDWGMEGYILLQMGQDTCGVADEATYPVV